METILALLLALGIPAAAGGYLLRAKKRGEHCVGCPYAKQCSGRCAGHTTETE